MGLLSWLKEGRRKNIIASPTPNGWEGILMSNVAHYCTFSEEERRTLMDLVKVFVAEKYWEGCGGLLMTDEIKVTIAGQACILIMNLPHDYYRNVLSILVYPSTVVMPEREQGIFEVSREPVHRGMPLLGQAFKGGPVILVWDAVQNGGRHPETGANVVYHEFAHKLDMLDGVADGTPPLASRKEYAEWVEVFAREFLRLRALSESGKRSFLDSYGATNEAEFFAVATEQFFDSPHVMKSHAPDLYRVLMEYYRQDTIKRVGADLCALDDPAREESA